jgi:di/tricarboxylate transporter
MIALALILLIAFALMLSNRLRPDLVAISVALALGLTGLIPLQQIFSGFSSPAVITIIAIFVLAHGLERTGVTRWIGTRISKVGGGEAGMVLTATLTGAFLSLFMNNIAAAAVAMPATADAVRRRRIPPSKVMLPLAFGTALGGMATLLTTGNIVVSAALVNAGLRGFGLLDFAALGVPIVAIGALYLMLIGRRLLPVRDLTREIQADVDIEKTYRLGERLNALSVPNGSPLDGCPLANSGIGREYGMSVMAIVREGQTRYAPPSTEVIRAGDTLLVIGRSERARQLIDTGAFVETPLPANTQHAPEDTPLVEVLLAPRSRAVGQTLRDLRFREKFGGNVLAIWHGGRSVRTDLAALLLQPGDALLVQAGAASRALIQSEPDFLVLGAPPATDQAVARPILATVILVSTLVVTAAGLLPIEIAMMLGALAMVLTGCLSMDQAYRAVDWRSVFLVAGLLPVSLAMISSGAADALSNALLGTLSAYGPQAVGAGLLLLTALLAQVMSGQVTGVVLAPIAITAAQALGADPRAMAMMVALGTSMTFLTPNAHPVNTFVMGAGGYRPADYLRVGLGLFVLVALIIVPLSGLVHPRP